MSLVVGLDPGMDGAAVVLTSEGHLVGRGFVPSATLNVLFRDFTIPAPTRGRQYDHVRLARALKALVGSESPLCVLEAGHSVNAAKMRGSSHAIGVGYGLLLGIVAANEWRVRIVRPAVWQRALFGKHAAGEPKARAIGYVRDQLPMFDTTADGRFRKPHQGLADAACLASYGLMFTGDQT